MYRFAHPYYLYALLLIPVFLVVFIMLIRWKRKALAQFGDWNVVMRLVPLRSTSRAIFKFILFSFAFAMLVIAIANPQIGSKLEKVQRKGIDLMVALDVSNSMLAEDIKPNRLERAKQALSKLIEKLDGDQIGLVVFAGKAYTQLPITNDYAAAKLFLSTVRTDMIPVQGTAIGEALSDCMTAFKDSKHTKAIVIISDGEDHEGNVQEMAQKAAEQGIRVYTIGMGSVEGAPIPMYRPDGGVVFKKDKDNNTVLTRLNETMLQQIAAAGNGIFVRADNTETGLNKIFDEINKLEKSTLESTMFSDYEDRFQYFLGLGLFLLLIEFLLFEKKSKWLGRIKLFHQ